MTSETFRLQHNLQATWLDKNNENTFDLAEQKDIFYETMQTVIMLEIFKPNIELFTLHLNHNMTVYIDKSARSLHSIDERVKSMELAFLYIIYDKLCLLLYIYIQFSDF